MEDTKIFTEAEIQAMARRMSGDLSDPTGIYSRARKKLKEIQDWNKDSKKKILLNRLLKQQRKRDKIEEKAKPNEVKSFEDFRKEIGY